MTPIPIFTMALLVPYVREFHELRPVQACHYLSKELGHGVEHKLRD